MPEPKQSQSVYLKGSDSATRTRTRNSAEVRIVQTLLVENNSSPKIISLQSILSALYVIIIWAKCISNQGSLFLISAPQSIMGLFSPVLMCYNLSSTTRWKTDNACNLNLDITPIWQRDRQTNRDWQRK